MDVRPPTDGINLAHALFLGKLVAMENWLSSVLSTVINNDTIVLFVLITGIAVVLLALLILNFNQPESAVISEYGSSDEFESTLRKVLADTNVKGAARATNALEEYQLEQMSGRVEKLENEILEKDKKIADLNKRLTAAGGGTTVDGVVAAGIDELKEKIKELQARLHEYEIIEDDIADLSKFKEQNEGLKDEIEKLRAKLASMSTDEPRGAKSKPALNLTQSHSNKNNAEYRPADLPEFGELVGTDLVAEFEKVVSKQDAGTTDEPQIEAAKVIDMDDGHFQHRADVDYGNILVTRLQEMGVAPDSKEEAEVLIGDLRNLRMSDANEASIGGDSIKEDDDDERKEVS